MRVSPVMFRCNNTTKTNKLQTQFERKTNNSPIRDTSHKYSGNACADLAYASMFDSAIAKDLKMMGLI